MQMGYDFDNPWQGTDLPQRIGGFAGEALDERAGGAAPENRPAPEWTALRARFVALHALRRTLVTRAEASLAVGGFIDAGESVLAACRSDFSGVNPVCSGNGKAAWANIPSAAASPTSGGRGIQ